MQKDKFIALYDRLLGYAYRLTGHSELARDAVQDFYARLYDESSPMPPVDNPAAYAHRAVANLCRRRMRDDIRHRDLEQEMASLLPAYSDSDPFGLESLLAPLTEWQRYVVVKHDIEGFSCREIAVQTGRKPAAVRKVLSLAHIKMRNNEY